MIIFVHNKFKLSDPGTYMAPFIRGILTADKTTPGKVYFNHCENILRINGVDYVIGAAWNKYIKKAQVIIRPFDVWAKDRDKSSYQILVPPFDYDKHLYEKRLLESIGKPYDFDGVLLYHPLKLITEKWYGGDNLNDFSCVKLSGYALDIEDWHKKDTEEFYHIMKGTSIAPVL